MAKDRSFTAKLKKEKQEFICPICNQPIRSVLFVNSVRVENTNTWKFNESHIQVCKCNEKEVWG